MVTCDFCHVLFAFRGPNTRYCSVWCQVWSRVAIDAPTVCWPWLGTRRSDGYGRVTIASRPTNAHRAVAALVIGPVGGMVVMHTCDNPPCCNPLHLQIGTHLENMGDMATKGRSGPTNKPWTMPRGARHGRSKLSDADVVSIRAARAKGATCENLARAFSVYPGTISDIARGVTWGHIALAQEPILDGKPFEDVPDWLGSDNASRE